MGHSKVPQRSNRNQYRSKKRESMNDEVPDSDYDSGDNNEIEDPPEPTVRMSMSSPFSQSNLQVNSSATKKNARREWTTHNGKTGQRQLTLLDRPIPGVSLASLQGKCHAPAKSGDDEFSIVLSDDEDNDNKKDNQGVDKDNNLLQKTAAQRTQQARSKKAQSSKQQEGLGTLSSVPPMRFYALPSNMEETASQALWTEREIQLGLDGKRLSRSAEVLERIHLGRALRQNMETAQNNKSLLPTPDQVPTIGNSRQLQDLGIMITRHPVPLNSGDDAQMLTVRFPPNVVGSGIEFTVSGQQSSILLVWNKGPEALFPTSKSEANDSPDSEHVPFSFSPCGSLGMGKVLIPKGFQLIPTTTENKKYDTGSGFSKRKWLIGISCEPYSGRQYVTVRIGLAPLGVTTMPELHQKKDMSDTEPSGCPYRVIPASASRPECSMDSSLLARQSPGKKRENTPIEEIFQVGPGEEPARLAGTNLNITSQHGATKHKVEGAGDVAVTEESKDNADPDSMDLDKDGRSLVGKHASKLAYNQERSWSSNAGVESSRKRPRMRGPSFAKPDVSPFYATPIPAEEEPKGGRAADRYAPPSPPSPPSPSPPALEQRVQASDAYVVRVKRKRMSDGADVFEMEDSEMYIPETAREKMMPL
ncbi:hypothetical protein BDZ91DRAFT_767011 [Kalaharituber pfeilii]|nr:hypothetical protein BDZ91DRAFT_767011 [Kalaharituber pfeilii]